MSYSTALVIGAGIAGLKAAIDLTAAGIPVQVLEARDRLGGRLFSEETPSGQTIDIGASWFHDCLNNPLLEKYYKQLNKGKKLEAIYDDFGVEYYDAKGNVDVVNNSITAIINEFYTYLAVICGSLPKEEDLSLRDALFKYLKDKAYTMTEEQLHYAQIVFRDIECFGSSWENMSAREIVNSDHYGRNWLLLNGFKTVYDGEMEDLLELTNKKTVDELLKENDSGVQLHLDTEVCVISKNYQTGKIEVSTKSKGIFTCDYIIVTAPLNVLKVTDPNELGCITWSPPLPKRIRDALDSTGRRNLGKLFLEFDEQFWSDCPRYSVLPDSDVKFTNALNKGQPLEKEILDFSTGKTVTPTMVVNLNPILAKKYGSTTNKPMLVFLTSEHITEKLELCYRNCDNEGIMKLIKPILARISNISLEEIPTPTFIRMTEWAFDPYARGSYTGTPVGQKLDYQEILQALTDPKGIFGESGVSRVRFAGEGTIKLGARCAHGAWMSGQREAKIIIDLVNKPKL